MSERNVLGGRLEPCGTEPMTGFYRDGCCRSGAEDRGSHTICAVVTAEFLAHQRRSATTSARRCRMYGFPGLVPGDRWCVTARQLAARAPRRRRRLRRARRDAERALEIVPLEALREHAVDVPADPGSLGA